MEARTHEGIAVAYVLGTRESGVRAYASVGGPRLC